MTRHRIDVREEPVDGTPVFDDQGTPILASRVHPRLAGRDGPFTAGMTPLILSYFHTHSSIHSAAANRTCSGREQLGRDQPTSLGIPALGS